MVWTTPPTWSTGQPITSSFLNALRDNLLETAVAKATTPGSHFAATGVNSLAERLIVDSIVDTQETTLSTTFTNLTTNGPVVTVTTGPLALVWINCQLGNSGGSQTYASFEISGATTSGATDARGVCQDGGSGLLHRYGTCNLAGLTAGSNTFRMQYRANAGTATFLRRRMQVMSL